MPYNSDHVSVRSSHFPRSFLLVGQDGWPLKGKVTEYILCEHRIGRSLLGLSDSPGLQPYSDGRDESVNSVVHAMGWKDRNQIRDWSEWVS